MGYFSEENLIKDVFLRGKGMNDEGWVSVQFLAHFKRVQAMTTDLSLIMDALQCSEKLEFDSQNQRVRLRNNWQRWIFTAANRVPRDTIVGDSPEKAETDQ